jgi:hypothetical protein
VLLRLVTQSAARAERYAILLEEAYEAAERLKRAFDAGALEIDEGKEIAETAREDLDRIFNTGGVAALVGNTYGAAKDVGVYVTGEAIRGLADLEAKERERCANFASKAVAAGLNERMVRLAERQGELIAHAVRAILEELQLTPEQKELAPTAYVDTWLRSLPSGLFERAPLLFGVLVGLAGIVGGFFVYMSWAHDTGNYPYEPTTVIDLKVEDGYKVEHDFAADLEGNVDGTDEHVWLATYDEAHQWYPLTEVFRKAESNEWKAELRREQLGAKSKVTLHAIVADAKASSDLATQAQGHKGQPDPTLNLPQGARSVDYALIEVL